MKFTPLILLTMLVSSIISAQYNPGAKQIALSNSDVALSNDVFALFNNPGGLSQINWREIGIYYSPAPFGFSELSNGYVAYNEPTSFGSFAVGGMTYGFELYRESRFTLGYSYNYDDKFFGGLSVNYQTVSIKNYGSDGAFYLNFGGLIYVLNDFSWGFYINNLNRASYGNDDDQIPIVYATGFSYSLIDELSLNCSVEKDISYDASFNFGIEYSIIKYLTLRSGFSNEPTRYSAGIGINYSLFSLDYAIFTHPDLGLTHQAGVIIKFKD